MGVASKPPAGAAEAAAKPDVKDDGASRPGRPKVDLQYFPGGASSKFSVSMLAWLYRTGHTGKVGKATFIADSPSGPAPLGPSLRTIGSFAVPNVNLSNPPMHGLHIRNPVHILPSDPPENGTGPHGGWIGSTHRYGAAELANFDPQNDHFGDLKNVQITYNTSTSPPQSEGSFDRNLDPLANAGITYDDDLFGEVFTIDDQPDSSLSAPPAVFGVANQIATVLLVPNDFDTGRLVELTPDWRDDAGGPLASFPLYADKHAKVGRAQFVLVTQPSSRETRLTLRISIYADVDLADGRHAVKLRRSDGNAVPAENVIEIHVTPLAGGVSFSEAKLEADLTALLQAEGGRTDFLVGSTLTIEKKPGGDGDSKPLITGRVPAAR
jgi:hypothetical protein